jgi:hypothetical protein
VLTASPHADRRFRLSMLDTPFTLRCSGEELGGEDKDAFPNDQDAGLLCMSTSETQAGATTNPFSNLLIFDV